MSLYVGDRVVCRFRWNSTDTIDPPDDQHLVARNMQRIGVNKCKENNCASSWLITKDFTLIRLKITKIYFESHCCLCICPTCCGL